MVNHSEITLPTMIPNRYGGDDHAAGDGGTFEKRAPHDGSLLWTGARSGPADVAAAVEAARLVQSSWADTPAVLRGEVLNSVSDELLRRRAEVAEVVALETGRPVVDADGEVGAAIACGRFFAGEGQRLYGRTTTSSTPGRHPMTVRQPIGVAGLIIAANTPIANVAWKVFPALIAGNAAVLKASENAPATAWLFAVIAELAGLPPGLLSVAQGLGAEAGASLVEHPDVGVVSFTGSSAVGRGIAATAGERLARVSLELGGKNPFVVCDDADLDLALEWALKSAFSNAGQRCAAGSRILVFRDVYEPFVERLVEGARGLRLGCSAGDDLGPVISEVAMRRILDALETAKSAGATVLCGGGRPDETELRSGYYIEPTIIEGAGPGSQLWERELFGPVTIVRRVDGLEDAVDMANDTPYGLTAAIHTRDLNRAMTFAYQVEAGVAVINGGTHGSEPHLPFGGRKASGNGTREPGSEALDVYTELKNIVVNVDRENV